MTLLGVGTRTSGNRTYFDGYFRLRETGGISGAVVTEIALLGGGTDAETVTQVCWGHEIRVEAGGVLEALEWQRLTPSHCAPSTLRQSALAPIEILVSFVDDAGNPGVAGAGILDYDVATNPIPN